MSKLRELIKKKRKEKAKLSFKGIASDKFKESMFGKREKKKDTEDKDNDE